MTPLVRATSIGAVALAVVVIGCTESRGTLLELQRLESRGSLVWGGEQRLVANDAAELDQFGWSVSLSGDRALVGAYGEGSGRGAAYVVARSDNGWIEEQKLVAGDGAELDKFGWSVSLAGDRALVGAYAAHIGRGAAYVFVKSGNGWIEEQKLVASDGTEFDKFGWSVSLAGDRALVGAYGSDAVRGAAYVFVRNGRDGSGWIEEQKLVARDGAAGDSFGTAVSLAGDRALLGAPWKDGYRGAAYVFVRAGGGDSWTEEQKLVARDGVANDEFGTSVSLAGDRALVGAYWDDDLRGAAYAFVRNGSDGDVWAEEQKLVASDGAAGHRFGNSVSLAVDRALVGAFGYPGGAAYAFARSGSDSNVWIEEQRLVASDGAEFDLFAWSVSLTADGALIGANYADQLRGAAYHFSLGVEDGDAGSTDAGAADGQDGDPFDAGATEPGLCIRGDECTSGYCEDAICCDRVCGPSERCRANLKVSGPDGVCGPAKAAALGAPCKFGVQCTSGHCAGVDGVCASAPGLTAPGDDAGCACRAGRSPVPRPWFGVVLLLMLFRHIVTRTARPRQ